jgi:uncharacterized membrane protein YdbT with pleckstrin-like domain
MGYISENLMKNEVITYRGCLHWVIYAPAVAFGVLTLVFAALKFPILAAICLLLAAWGVLAAWMRQHTTEFAVTNKRVIGKTGFIKRDTIDLNLAKVESLYADQGVWGRMFSYGAVRIVGTGGSNFIVKGALNPVAFKRAANEQIDAAQS